MRITEGELIVYDPQLGEVARHLLVPRSVSGQRCIQHAHHPPADDSISRSALLRERYAELGPVPVRFLEGLVRTQRYHRDQAQRVLALLATWARADWLAALDRAARYGAYSASAVERILVAQARPKNLLSSLAEDEGPTLVTSADEDVVRPRPTSEYQPLLPPDPDADEPPAREECPF